MASKTVLVTGGRYFNLKDEVAAVLGSVHKRFGISELHEGGATGADELCRLWALMNNIPVFTHEADWKVFGNRAGSMRNSRMLRTAKPDLVVAFPGGTGTADMVKKSLDAGVQTIIGSFIGEDETAVRRWRVRQNG